MSREIWVPFMPPSANNMKTKRKNPRTKKVIWVDSDELQSFRKRFVAEVVPIHQGLIKEADEILEDPNLVLVVRARVYFERLTTKGWPETAKNRFVIVDADNRGKATFDCLSRVLGKNDSLFFQTSAEKYQGTPEGVRLFLRYAWCSDFGVPEV